MSFTGMDESQLLNAGFWTVFAVVPGASRSQETRLPRWQQSSPEQKEVCQRKSLEQPGRVLRQAAITDFAKTPQPLDDMKSMLTPRSGLRAAAVDRLLMFGQRLLSGTATVDSIAHTRLFGAFAVKLAPVGLIAKQTLLLAMQQLRQLADIGRVSWRGIQTAHNTARTNLSCCSRI